MKKGIIAVSIAVAFALIARFLFGIDSFSEFMRIMSLSFLALIPISIGAITIALTDKEKARRPLVRIFMPWIPVILFFLLTLLLSIEGWACWLMVLPFFLLGASIGGLIMGYIRLKKKNGTVQISLLTLLPFLCAPLEQYIGSEKEVYEVYTYSDINGSAENIWQNVTSVTNIESREDNGDINKFLGMPRPIKAELNYKGIGAEREAIFEGGLIFHEKVLAYSEQDSMLFSITANPFEIPSTTMDEHIVVGGEYFDVIDGSYKLQKISGNTYRLHLTSHFSMNTTFNFYAGWWGKLIMSDIQNNILQVIKTRVEG